MIQPQSLHRMVGLVLCAICLSFSPARGEVFADVPTDHWAYDAISYLQEKGMIEGYPDGMFKGERMLTRYEFAIVAARMHRQVLDIIEAGGRPAPDVDAIAERLRNEFQADIEELRAMLEEQDARLHEAEVAIGDMSNRMDKTDKAIADRLGTVKLSGDLRARLEITDPNEAGKDETKHSRIRVRLRGEAKVNDEVKAVMRLATGGESAIVSTNESHDDYFALDAFDLDLAYLEWTPQSSGFLGKDWKLTAGKFQPTWASTLMTFDTDVTPEGLGWNFFTSDDHWRVNLAQLQPNKTGIYLVNQVGYTGIADFLDLYATYHHMDDKAFFSYQKDASDTAKKLPNQMLLDEIADYSNFRQWEILARMNLTELFNGSYPLTLTANYLEAMYDAVPGMNERQNKGAYVNLAGGKLTNPGDWSWFLEWGKFQPNATFTIWADGDRGVGNTEFIAGQVSYRWLKNLDLALTVIDWDRLFPSTSEEGALRVQMDAISKF